MTRAYLSLGSNLGDRRAYLQGAIDSLRSHPRIDVVQVSSVYETAPVGGPEQGAFLNVVVAVDHDGDDAYDLLAIAQGLEHDAQRVREVRWGPRTLDVDVLRYGSWRSDDPTLTVPHPRMHERAFVLVPLAEIARELVDEIPADDGVSRLDEALR